MRKRFFHLSSGPLAGRVLSPGSAYRVAAGNEWSTRFMLAVEERLATLTPLPSEEQLAPRSAEHFYEAFDIVDEVSLEIVLCRYVATHPSTAPAQN